MSKHSTHPNISSNLEKISDKIGYITSNGKAVKKAPLLSLLGSQVIIARLLNVSRQAVNQQEHIKINPEAQYRISLLVQSSNLLITIFDNDQNRAMDWLSSPNEYFLGKRPVDLIIEGNGQELVDWLKART